jgi:hypothetical protein
MSRSKGSKRGVLSAPGIGLYPAVGSLSRDEEAAVVRSVAAAIESEWRIACGSLLKIGQLVIDSCYAGDPREALADARGRNGRFADISRKLNALGIGLGTERLSIARRIVAWNHVIRSPHWDRLDDGHKEVLLPLAERTELVAGSRYALEAQATKAELAEWVRKRRKALGSTVVARGLRWKTVSNSLGRLEQSVSPASLERIGKDFGKLGAEDQRAARDQLRRMRAVLEKLEKRLAGA